MKKELPPCEHKECKSEAKWMVRSHAFGLVSFDHNYCDEHFNLHISSYKLEPSKDIVRL